ncbi:MAG TPA: hypothetical protein VJN96_09905 [Vicinamibacterales bacterium]|nr:hypothetical protein [Vicinamibacterales bacterium]
MKPASISLLSALAILVATAAPDIRQASPGSAAPQRGTVEWRIEHLAGVRVEDVKHLLASLKQSVAAGDRKAVCALATYPLRVLPLAEREIPSAARCVSQYSRIFSGEVVSAVAKQRFEDLFVSWQGVRIGDDEIEIWMAGVCRDPDCRQYDFRMISVNSPTFLDAAARGVQVRDVLSGPLASPAWTTRPGPPSARELECTSFSYLFWSTSVKDGVPYATRIGMREHLDPLPFRVSPGRDRAGDRWAVPVSDGWIVGFSLGEFGGGLWWFNRNGTTSRRIRPGPTAPANPADPFRAENVLGLPTVGGEQLVLMGLDHLTGRSGRVFRLVQSKTDWTLEPVAVLDAEPDVWLIDGNRLLILTESALWSVEPGGVVTQLHQSRIGELSASAMVRAPDGGIYVGLRHYVVKLDQSNGQWRETWFAPSVCATVEMKENRCECGG